MRASVGSLRSGFLPGMAALALVVAVAPVAAEETSTHRTGPLGWLLSSSPRAPQPWHKYGDFTLGGSVGWSRYQDHTSANDDGSLSKVDARDDDIGWNVGGGFAGRWAGVEFGYMNFGRSEFDATSSGGPSWPAGPVSAKVEGSGWALSGLVRLPVKPRWVMFGRLGLLSWTSTETFTESNGTFVTKSEDSGSNTLYGGGFEYDVYSKDRFWLRTEFMRAQVDDDKLPVLGVNGSLVFHY